MVCWMGRRGSGRRRITNTVEAALTAIERVALAEIHKPLKVYDCYAAVRRYAAQAKVASASHSRLPTQQSFQRFDVPVINP